MSPVAVVTGASAGVGRAVVRALAEEGYDVAALARGPEGLAGAVADAEARGVRARGYQVDVAEDRAVDDAASRAEQDLGPVDVWVNNAMASVFGSFLDLTAEEFDRVTAVTYTGTVNGTRAALRRMRPRDRGRIVQVGSALAYRGIPLQSAYCAGKHATQGLCDSLRTELLHEGSRVTISMVQLPAVNTPQFDIQRNKMPRKARPVPPIFQPEVAAQAVAFAVRTGKRELWVGAPAARAILGNKLFPAVLDELLGRTGYASQQRDEPQPPDAPDVLFSPLHRDLGAYGSFGDLARPRSRLVELTTSPAVHRVRQAVGGPVTRAFATVLARVT
jgi:NAD(P)-dependent dehydrogenase (short-subunit alcohol dehydrogenase family)